MKTLSVTLLLSVLTASGARAADDMHQHEAMTPAQQSYQQGMTAMHEKMMDGLKAQDADVAFAQGMIAHHQGRLRWRKPNCNMAKILRCRSWPEKLSLRSSRKSTECRNG